MAELTSKQHAFTVFCGFLGELFGNSIHLMVLLSRRIIRNAKLKAIFHYDTLLEAKYECKEMLFALLLFGMQTWKEYWMVTLAKINFSRKKSLSLEVIFASSEKE